jgi:GNAT superfamily N-acetyltransferase
MDATGVVRRASIGECDTIASLLLAAFESYRPLYTPAAFAATTPTPGQLRRRWHEGPVWIALEGERSVGTVSAVVREASLYMRSMAVHPASRGGGCGRRLLDAVEAHARDQGCARVELSTTPFLHPAIALYERSGFVRVGRGPHDLEGTPLFTMEKVLRPA